MVLSKEENAKWVKDLVRLLEARHWSLAVPKPSGDDEIQGFVIGTDKYIDWVLASEGERCVD